MADDVYTTLLNFVTESSDANRDIKKTTESLKKMEDQAAKVGSVDLGKGLAFPSDELSKDFDLFNKAFDKTFGRVKDKLKDFRTDTTAAAADLRKFSTSSEEDLQKIAFGAENLDAGKIRELAKQTGEGISAELAKGLAAGNLTQEDLFEIEGIRKQVEEIKGLEESRKKDLQTTIQASRIKSQLLLRESSLLQKQATDIRQNAQILRGQAQQLQSISQLGLGAGVGIVGGIFAFASKYVNDAKEATAVTVAWKEAQESLGKSGQKIGAVLAQEALPLLRLAAETAQKAAGFIEKHPEIVRAALNTGIVLAGLGAVGLAVSKGIKLYADQLYLSSIPLQLEAGRLQFAAAQEQLVAARLKAGIKVDNIPVPPNSSRVPGAPGGNILGTLAKVTLIATSVIIGAELGLALGNALAKLIDPNAKDMTMKETLFFGGIRAIEAIEQKFNNTLIAIGEKIPDLLGGKLLRTLGETNNDKLQKADQFWKNILIGVDELALSSEKLTGVRGSSEFEAVLGAYEDYKRDDLALVQKHYAERSKTISDSLKAEAKSNADYTRDSARIRSQLGKSVSDATKSYEEQSRKSEVQDAQERARIIRDGGQEIQRIEENLQEKLRKLRLDHEDRLEDLVGSRDALGIDKEQQRYNRERSEEVRQTNIDIRQRREDLGVRLKDQQETFQQERAQRLVDFQERLKELRANAVEQQKELAARHREEISQIRAQRAERIKELDNQLKEERKRRNDYFIDQIRKLDENLIGEAGLRKRRQDEMIKELDLFLLRYKSGMSKLQVSPVSHAAGGYATYGSYLLGDMAGGGRGKPEYVLRGDVTELAERVLGGRISQDKMIALLSAANGGSRNNVTYNDSRRIDSRVSNIDRKRMMDDTFTVLDSILG